MHSESSDRPRQPWCHSLLLALVLLTCPACVGLPVAGPAPPPQAAKPPEDPFIAHIKKLGGEVRFNPALLPASPIVAIDLHHTRANDADLAQIQGLPNLRILNLYGTRVTDAGLVSVAAMTGLQALYLNDTAVTDAGLRQLEKLSELRELGLHETRVTDEGLIHLRELKNLSDLTLGGRAITDRGLTQLKGVKHLKRLVLIKTGVTKAGVDDLHKALPDVQIVWEKQ